MDARSPSQADYADKSKDEDQIRASAGDEQDRGDECGDDQPPEGSITTIGGGKSVRETEGWQDRGGENEPPEREPGNAAAVKPVHSESNGTHDAEDGDVSVQRTWENCSSGVNTDGR
ncbi:hypothetical protein GCM10022223_05690 [Kineosporia mesophila]|uniref:Uncharacterized protein n=1 Tax=Kineosporia mesophila TaxID=566012 RepID=A0ABP6Z269_9ACTN